ncbi:MAG: hypothetical protein IJO54_02785 [Oscillospiraceae bacterium]|nr:hypothetical protein [Oscillospiraceae bacterium]
MKKILALLTAAALCLSVTACGADSDNNATDTVDSTNYKVGVGSYTTTEDSSSSVEGSGGKGVVSTTYATVIFDENDIIRKIYIDEVESKIYFDGQGSLDENKNSRPIRTKRELGDEYGMKAASNIGKEWYEQINSLEAYLEGKNLRDISDYVMNNGYYGTENDYADSLGNETADGAADGVAEGAKGIAEGAKGIADGIVNGARNIMGRNSASSDTNGTNTAEGITDNTGSTVADGTNDYNQNANSATSDENYISNNDGSSTNGDANGNTSSSTDGNASGNTSGAGKVNWEEDLKASVTIDMTNIQRAVQKAWENAR